MPINAPARLEGLRLVLHWSKDCMDRLFMPGMVMHEPGACLKASQALRAGVGVRLVQAICKLPAGLHTCLAFRQSRALAGMAGCGTEGKLKIEAIGPLPICEM